MFTNFNSFRSQLRKKIVNKLHKKSFNFLGVKLQQKRTPTKAGPLLLQSDKKSFLGRKIFTATMTDNK